MGYFVSKLVHIHNNLLLAEIFQCICRTSYSKPCNIADANISFRTKRLFEVLLDRMKHTCGAEHEICHVCEIEEYKYNSRRTSYIASA